MPDTLNLIDAVRILFGDQILDPDFQADDASFASASDVCEALYDHFSLDDKTVTHAATWARLLRK